MSELKRTLLLAGILICVTSFGWFLFFYRPKIAEINRLRGDTERLLTKFRLIKVSDIQIQNLQERVVNLEKEISVNQTKVFPKSELPSIVRQIKRKGISFGLKFLNITPEYDSLIRVPDDEDASSDLIKLVVHFQLQGTYKNCGRFIDSMEEFPFFISVGEISFYYTEKIYPQLEFMLDAILYLRETVDLEDESRS